MNLSTLVAIHNDSIRAMNEARDAVSRIEDALRCAKASLALASRNETILAAAVTAADKAERGQKG